MAFFKSVGCVMYLIIFVFLLFAIIAYKTSKRINDLDEIKIKRHDPLAMPGTPEWKGQDGERKVQRILSCLPKQNYIVLNDVLIPTKAGTTQLDHVVVSIFGLFIIETKNYSGKIYGGENSDQWTEYLAGQKYVFYNPIRQNYGHAQAVAKYTHVDPCYIFPIVVFTGSAIIKSNVGEQAVLIDHLFETITHYKNKFLQWSK